MFFLEILFLFLTLAHQNNQKTHKKYQFNVFSGKKQFEK